MSWSAKSYRGAPGDYKFELASPTAREQLDERQRAIVDKAGDACASLAQALSDAEEITVTASGHSPGQPPGDSLYINVTSVAPAPVPDEST